VSASESVSAHVRVGNQSHQLQEKDLGDVGVPAWSGDRQRILAAIEHLKNPSMPPPPVNPAPSVMGGDAGFGGGGGRAFEKVPDSPVNEWLLSTGFGRFRSTFSQYQIFELHDLCQLERQDLLDLGIPDQGGQLGRLEAAIGGLRYTLQASHAALGRTSVAGAGLRGAGGLDDASSRWETETVSTSKSGRSRSSRRSKSREGRRKKKIDFTLIEEAVKVSDVYGHKWDKRFAQLEANRLCLFKSDKPPRDKLEKPKTELLLDGLIIDESDKKEDAVFIVKSLFANSSGDMLIHFANAKTAKLWKERLQAASFFHNLPRDKQIAGLAAAAADKPKTPGGTEADTSRPLFDAYGNRLPQNPPKGLHFHNLPAEHTERERPQAAKGGGETAEVGAAESVKAVGGKGQATKASAYFRGPLKSFTIIGMEVCVCERESE
jgi:hypothetical protein